MWNKLSSLITWASTLVTNDTDKIKRTAIVKGLSKSGNVFLITPYGFDHHPPNGSLSLVLQVMANEGNRTAIAAYPQKRFDNLKEGEVAVGNYLTRAIIKFNEDGDVEVYAPRDVSVTAGRNATIYAEETARIDGKIVEIHAREKISYDVNGYGEDWIYNPGDDNYRVDTYTIGNVVAGTSNPIDPPEHNK